MRFWKPKEDGGIAGVEIDEDGDTAGGTNTQMIVFSDGTVSFSDEPPTNKPEVTGVLHIGTNTFGGLITTNTWTQPTNKLEIVGSLDTNVFEFGDSSNIYASTYYDSCISNDWLSVVSDSVFSIGIDHETVLEISWDDGTIDVTHGTNITEAAEAFFDYMKSYASSAYTIFDNRTTPTNAIQMLVDDGRVCEVIGHRWTDAKLNQLAYGRDYQHSVPLLEAPHETRACMICSKTQTKTERWEDE